MRRKGSSPPSSIHSTTALNFFGLEQGGGAVPSTPTSSGYAQYCQEWKLGSDYRDSRFLAELPDATLIGHVRFRRNNSLMAVALVTVLALAYKIAVNGLPFILGIEAAQRGAPDARHRSRDERRLTPTGLSTCTTAIFSPPTQRTIFAGNSCA